LNCFGEVPKNKIAQERTYTNLKGKAMFDEKYLLNTQKKSGKTAAPT
jgi:hypothetical protein